MQASAAAAETQLSSLRTEREALLDWAADAQRQQSEAAAAATALRTITAANGELVQQLAAAQSKIAAQAAQLSTMESQCQATDARAGEAALRITELQVGGLHISWAAKCMQPLYQRCMQPLYQRG